jgi:hypothetical protein
MAARRHERAGQSALEPVSTMLIVRATIEGRVAMRQDRNDDDVATDVSGVAAMSRPGWRAYGFGLGLVGVVLAIVIGTPAALVVATGRTCACAQPPDLIVQNASTSSVTVTWKREGLTLAPDENGAGTVVVEACASMNTTLPQGTVHVVVTSVSEVEEFDLDIPQRYATSPFAWRVVHGGGVIKDAGPTGPTDDPLANCVAEGASEG